MITATVLCKSPSKPPFLRNEAQQQIQYALYKLALNYKTPKKVILFLILMQFYEML